MNKGKGEVGLVIIIVVLVLLILGGIYYYINFLNVENPIEPIQNSGEVDKIQEIVIDDSKKSGESGDEGGSPVIQISGEDINKERHYMVLSQSSVRKLLNAISVAPSRLGATAKKTPNHFHEYELGYLKRDIEDYKIFFAVRYISSSDSFTSKLYVQNGGGEKITIFESNSIDVDSYIYTSIDDRYIYSTVVNSDKSVTLVVFNNLFKKVATYKLIIGDKPLNIEIIDGILHYSSYDTYTGQFNRSGLIFHKYLNTYYKVSEVDGVITREIVSEDNDDYVLENKKREE